jgi:hypothetical protein
VDEKKDETRREARVIMVVVIGKRKVMPQIEGGWGRWHQRAGEVQQLGTAANGGASQWQGLVGQSHSLVQYCRLVGLIVKRRQQQIKARRGAIGSSHRSGLGAKKSESDKSDRVDYWCVGKRS